MTTHIAQLSIGWFRYPTHDPRMAAFMARNLDRINALAERSEGFAWRLKDDSNNATAIRPSPPTLLCANPSVWRALKRSSVFATVHKQVYNRKGDWFETLGKLHFVMSSISIGHIPDLEEAMTRLEHLAGTGTTLLSVGVMAHIKLWMSQKCG